MTSKQCPKCGSTDTEPDKMFRGLTKCKSCGLITDDERFQSLEGKSRK